MISGALRPTHCSSNLHFVQVTAPDNDVVNEMLVYGPGMHPRCLVYVTEVKEGVFSVAEREQSENTTIHVANAMMTNGSMPYVMISAYPGIEIA